MSKYREQYERMKRMYGRFEETSCRLSSVEFSGQSLIDDGLVFFQSCMHLQEWIRYDKKLPKTVRDAACPYVKNSKFLSLCYDSAIGAKHLAVDRPLAPGKKRGLNPVRTVEPRSAEMFYDDDDDNFLNSLPPGTPVLSVSVRLVMEADGSDALEFGRDCIKEWDRFFKLHGLP